MTRNNPMDWDACRSFHNVSDPHWDELQQLGVLSVSSHSIIVRTPLYESIQFIFAYNKWACHASSDTRVQYGDTPINAYLKHVEEQDRKIRQRLEVIGNERVRVTCKNFLPVPEITDWIDIEDHCSMRCIANADPSLVENRVAFIEITPRVRVLPFSDPDNLNWQYGPRGYGEYGKCETSRAWCDDLLRKLGYNV